MPGERWTQAEKERLIQLCESAGLPFTATPNGPWQGNNDGKVRDASGAVRIDCLGNEALAELLGWVCQHLTQWLQGGM